MHEKKIHCKINSSFTENIERLSFDRKIVDVTFYSNVIISHKNKFKSWKSYQVVSLCINQKIAGNLKQTWILHSCFDFNKSNSNKNISNNYHLLQINEKQR